ncbi:hypothetical protein ACGFIP_01265 [Micromonospora zamorensis]|uniref:hypothetical protein n=1 Tax=Micromonospora zamorensis TaxID=709883 RepID=UPI003722B7D5
MTAPQPADHLAARVSQALAQRAPRHLPYPAEEQTKQARIALRRSRGGTSLDGISRELGIARKTVKKRIQNALGRYEFAVKFTAEEVADQLTQCAELRQQGVGSRSIARRLGISRDTVLRRLREAERTDDQTPTAQPQ